MNRVPKLRFKEFSGDWEEKKLGDIADCLDNKRKPLNSAERDKIKGEIPYYGANGIQGYINDFIFDEELILLAEDGGNFDDFLNKPIAQYIYGKSWINNHAHILKGKKGIFTKFLFYSLVHKDIRSFINGTSRSKLNKSDMLNININLSYLKEQEKTADFLSSIEKKISNTEKKLDLFKDYKKGIMQKIFNQELRFKDSEGNDYPEWEEKRLGDVFSFKQGYQIPFKEQIKIKEKGYVRYLYISDFFSDKNLLYVKDDGKEKITETDITVANTGNTAGSFYRGKSGILSNNMFNIQNDEKVVTNDFLFQFLGTSLYSNQLKTFFNSSGQPHLGHKNMSMIIINYPVSFEEQQKIANFLSSIDKKNDNLATELENLKEFKKGLLQQMFI